MATGVYRRKLDFRRSPEPEPPVHEDGAVRVFLDAAGTLQLMNEDGTTSPLAGADGPGTVAASAVTVADAGNVFAAANVEAALAELDARIATLPEFD